MQGWDYAASYGEIMTAIHAHSFINSNRESKSKIVDLPFPWSSKSKQADVTAEERAALKRKLVRHSAFAA